MTNEERAAYMKKYRQEHKEQIKANQEYYRAQNPDLVNAYSRKYHNTHKDDPEYKRKKKENFYKWLEKNRDKYNAYQRERARRLRGQI